MTRRVETGKPGEKRQRVPAPGGEVVTVVLSRRTVAAIRRIQARKRAQREAPP